MENLELVFSVITLMVVASVISVAAMMFVTEGPKGFTPIIEEWVNLKGLLSLIVTVGMMSLLLNTPTIIVVVVASSTAFVLGLKVKGALKNV